MDSSGPRSTLIDYTYQHIDSIISGQRDGTRPDQVEKILEQRIEKLKNLTEPFGKPSDVSKKKVDGGSVELSDGVKINVLDVDKEVIFAISSHLSIDQVDAFILLRSFLYNEGLPPIPDSGSTSSLVEELLFKITPFYFSERLHVPRVVMCLLRAHQSLDDPFHRVAAKILPKIISEPTTFVKNLVAEYQRKSKLSVPDHAINDPKAASQWAKQNAKEQLGVLELLFSALWDFVPCIAPIVVAVYEAAYSGKFGYEQANSTSMLDEEGQQVQRDLSAIWLLLTIEVLNLEQIGSPGLELSEGGDNSGLLVSSPQALEKVHILVMGHSSAGYACTMLAWAFYLKGICDAASQMAERPHQYLSFLREIRASSEVAHRKGEKELHHLIVANVLRSETGIFGVLSELLTQSPFFSTSMAGKTGSAVSEPNSISYRALVKGLLISLLDYEPVELIPDFEGLVNVWIALFGVSEKAAVASICRQYWDFDWRQGKTRRAIIDVARQRFPIQPRPLIRLLRAMTGAGFVETSETLKSNEQDNIDLDHQICSSYVFHYFLKLTSYSQVIPVPLKSGANALYDRIIDRGPGSSRGAVYTNARPVTLPGGSTLTQKSIGRLLSPDSSSEPVVVAWQHEHSGWKLIVELLIDFIGRRLGSTRVPTTRIDSALSRRDTNVTLQLDDIGLERDVEEEFVVSDALELVLSIIQGNPALTGQLMESLELGGSPVSFVSKDSTAPDLVQVIFMILEDALSRAQNRRHSASPLVPPAIGVLSALLSVPTYSNRVWLFLRSTSMLFGSDRDPHFTSAVLATERSTGNYKMTISLLRLVRNLFEEAVTTLLITQSGQPRLQAVKEEVLLRAIKFIHGQIWTEHSGWRYARLGDKYEIGTQVTALYSQVMETMSAVSSANTFSSLSDYVIGITLHNATAPTISPLCNCIASGRSVLDALVKLRRFAEARQFTKLLENTLYLTRLILNVKRLSSVANKFTLLEQTLCSDISVTNTLLRTRSARVNCVDTLSWYIKARDLGIKIPLEAVKALTALCSSVSACGPSSPSLIGLFGDPIATMRSLVKIVTHPYDDLALRNAVWAFMSIVVEKQQALAVLFISGQLSVQTDRVKGQGKATESSGDFPQDAYSVNAVEAASRILTGWEALWESNPQLLASVLSFLDMVWTHSLEHAIALKSTKNDAEFWKRLSRIIKKDAGPSPDYVVIKEVDSDEGRRSELHDAASSHGYRLKAKGHALRVIGSEIAREGNLPTNFVDIKPQLINKDEMLEGFTEAASNSYDPTLYDNLVSAMQSSFASISVQSLKSIEPLYEREFGDNFVFSLPLLHAVVSSALAAGGQNGSDAETLKLLACSVNLNLTLAHAQLLLTDAWCAFLEKVKGYLAEGPSASGVRTVYLSAAATVIHGIALERRSGEFMCAIHGSRLRLVVNILEVAWFSPVERPEQTRAFMELLDDLDGVIKSETFPPAKSFLGSISSPFHRPLLQIIYFCTRNCQNIVRDSKSLKADHRIVMGRTLTSAVLLVIDALRLSFDTARTRVDVDLDKDMELLVAVFQQCTRSGLNASSISWLTKCQEADVINASLSLIAQADISGLSDLSLLRTRGQPLYSPHVLSFHMALASIPFSAERMASEGLVSAYCNNSISPALSEGAVDVILPELPGERSPVHRAYCLMLANLVGIIGHLTSPQQFVESHVVGFVQLYGKQLSRALSWTNDDPLTLPLLEELELTTELFYLMAETPSSRSEPSLSSVLQSFTEHSLLLLQQLNYALSHPKHLAGLLDPATADDRVRIDREISDLTVNSLSDLLDNSQKPLMTSVVRRLFGVAAKVLSTLTVLSNADKVLTSDPEEWSLREALVVPHSKVTMGEPASIGTLLELGNCSHETLQYLNQQLPMATAIRDKEICLSSIRIVRQTLECDLVYASTQLVMWLTKHDGEQGGDMEMDDQQDTSSYGHKAAENTQGPKDRDRERRMRRKSLTLADRLRRGMTGEMTMDLQTLVGKATPIVAKSTEFMGSSDVTDIMHILAGFLEERVIPQ